MPPPRDVYRPFPPSMNHPQHGGPAPPHHPHGYHAPGPMPGGPPPFGVLIPPPPEFNKSSIPILANAATAIFIPIEGDELIAPFTPPGNRVKRIEAKIAKLSQHKRKVRENYLALCRQDCLRQIQNTHMWEKENPDLVFKGYEDATTNPKIQKGVDIMIDNMSVGFEGKKTVSRPEGAALPQPPTQAEAQRHPLSRQTLVRDIEMTISQGLMDIKGFDGHVDKIRASYMEIYDRERKADKRLDFD